MLNLEILILGFIMGTFYVLMAVGLSLIFGILKIVNFAHGEFFMVGAYTYTLLALWTGAPVWASIVGALLGGALVGIVAERLLLRPLYEKFTDWQAVRDEYAIITTFGLSLLLINAANQILGPYPFQGPDLVRGRIGLGPLTMTGHRLAAFLVGAAILGAVVTFVRYSFWGKQIQAVAQNRIGAAIAGIDISRISSLVAALAGGLAAVSGALLAPLFHATPDVGVLPAMKSFVIVVLGGMGSLAGSIVGGLALGVLESFGSVYLSYAYRDTYAFVILIAVLLLRPWGLFGERAREV